MKSGTARCAVARLLSEMTDHVEGFFHFVFNFVIDGVNRCLVGDNPEIQDEHLIIIKEKFTLRMTLKTELIEVCLSVMAMVSYLIPQNKGLQVLFDQFMAKSIPQLYQENAQDVVVRFRMSMLLSFTMDFLFQTIIDTQAQEHAVDNLLRSLIEDIQPKPTKSTRALALIALETLKTSTGDD
jgi:hypothetical protein